MKSAIECITIKACKEKKQISAAEVVINVKFLQLHTSYIMSYNMQTCL